MPPPLQTQRLLLVPLSPDDMELFLRLNTTPHARQYLWDDLIIGDDTAKNILKENESMMTHWHYGLWKMILLQTEEVIGYTGLWFFFDEPQPQLIYVVKEDCTGEGFAVEGGRAVVAYAFEHLGFDHLIASMDAANVASQRTASRIGMDLIKQRKVDGKPTIFFRVSKQDNEVLGA